MIRAIAWKEWREQRAIALAVLTFGVLALALTSQFADPTTGGSAWSQAGPRELMAQALAYLAGTVCGAMLLADEKEIGTLEFLDTLPTTRRALWWGKVVFGLGLAFLQGAALAGLAIAFRCADPRVPAVAYAAVVILISLLAFAWGMFGGAGALDAGGRLSGQYWVRGRRPVLAVVFVVLFGPRAFTRSSRRRPSPSSWPGSGRGCWPRHSSSRAWTGSGARSRPAPAPARRARRPMRRLAGLRRARLAVRPPGQLRRPGDARGRGRRRGGHARPGRPAGVPVADGDPGVRSPRRHHHARRGAGAWRGPVLGRRGSRSAGFG